MESQAWEQREMCPPPPDRGCCGPQRDVEVKCCRLGREEKRARGWGGVAGDGWGCCLCECAPRSLFRGFILRASMGLI